MDEYFVVFVVNWRGVAELWMLVWVYDFFLCLVECKKNFGNQLSGGEQ